MKGYSSGEFAQALKEIGLKKGMAVLVSTDLLALGPMTDAGSAQETLKTLLGALQGALGAEGTLVVHTYTTQVGRYGAPFIHESTPCVNGAFCQYVLNQPGRVRSLHPINSFTALGRLREEICSCTFPTNFGWETPLDRLLRRQGQIVTVGIDYVKSAYAHYVEAMMGVPYLYNKLLDVEVVKDGQRVLGPFFASVRYLDLALEFDWEKLRRGLDEARVVSKAPLGSGSVHRVAAADYCRVLSELLRRDPYALLEAPPAFVKGRIPFDGITQGRDGTTERGNYRFMEQGQGHAVY